MSTQIKIFFQTGFTEGPWGGGNQFLKALRNEFIKRNCYIENPKEAGVILFNSHHYLDEIVNLRWKFPDKVFVHRVDGPMSYRGRKGEKMDRKIFSVNSTVADGTIFQSEWSRSESRKQGMKKNRFETIIHNAPDPDIFFSSNNAQEGYSKKIKLIASSWSNNPDKGFDIYHYLDENLDFEKYEMTFVGRIDKPFNKITVIDPVPSLILAKILRKHDIFVFASKREACSNSLIEALSCGLPAVVRNNSSNPEVMGKRGLTFNDKEDVISIIEIMIHDLETYKKIPFKYQIKGTGKKYLNFFKNISLSDTQRKKIHMFNQLKNWYEKT